MDNMEAAKQRLRNAYTGLNRVKLEYAGKEARAAFLAAEYDQLDVIPLGDTQDVKVDAAIEEMLVYKAHLDWAQEQFDIIAAECRAFISGSEPKGIIWSVSSDECVCSYCGVCRGE